MTDVLYQSLKTMSERPLSTSLLSLATSSGKYSSSLSTMSKVPEGQGAGGELRLGTAGVTASETQHFGGAHASSCQVLIFGLWPREHSRRGWGEQEGTGVQRHRHPRTTLASVSRVTLTYPRFTRSRSKTRRQFNENKQINKRRANVLVPSLAGPVLPEVTTTASRREQGHSAPDPAAAPRGPGGPAPAPSPPLLPRGSSRRPPRTSRSLTVLTGVEAREGGAEDFDEVAHAPQVLVHVPEVGVDVVTVPEKQEVVRG